MSSNWPKNVCYLKVFKEDPWQCFSEVRRTEDGLDDDHSSVTWIHKEMPANTAVTVHSHNATLTRTHTQVTCSYEIRYPDAGHKRMVYPLPEVQRVNELLQVGVQLLCVYVVLHHLNGLGRKKNNKKKHQSTFTWKKNPNIKPQPTNIVNN